MGELSKGHFTKYCISDVVMHIAAWYHGTPRTNFTKFGE